MQLTGRDGFGVEVSGTGTGVDTGTSGVKSSTGGWNSPDSGLPGLVIAGVGAGTG